MIGALQRNFNVEEQKSKNLQTKAFPDDCWLAGK